MSFYSLNWTKSTFIASENWNYEGRGNFIQHINIHYAVILYVKVMDYFKYIKTPNTDSISCLHNVGNPCIFCFDGYFSWPLSFFYINGTICVSQALQILFYFFYCRTTVACFLKMIFLGNTGFLFSQPLTFTLCLKLHGTYECLLQNKWSLHTVGPEPNH